MSKLFLNMVIHDCRNPTSSIKIGLSLIMSKIKEMNEINKDQHEFVNLSQNFINGVNQNLNTLTQNCRI